jgi:GTPase
LSDAVILVHVTFRGDAFPHPSSIFEFQYLATSALLRPVLLLRIKQDRAHKKTFVNQGIVQHIAEAVSVLKPRYVLFNHDLRAGFKRELEKAVCSTVIDRTELILDVFAHRAKTYEGKLQVELAQLNYLATRLVRGWTHLERQKGGLGLRGPGETQLETDRRLLRKRVQTIERRLARVASGRRLTRQSREKKNLLTVALVGYTNSGKSTLFNALTRSAHLSEDRFFATLDPALRYLDLPGIKSCILIDTVGFIEGLPHHLVKAFRATMEEVREAHVLLHVVDATSARRGQHQAVVLSVLEDLGVDEKPMVTVYNKADALLDILPGRIDPRPSGERIWLSALKKSGFDALRKLIEHKLDDWFVCKVLRLPDDAMDLKKHFYKVNAVLWERPESDATLFCVKRHRVDWQRDLGRYDVAPYVLDDVDPEAI